jgi:hypothetical protein
MNQGHAGSFQFVNPEGVAAITSFPIQVPGVSGTRGNRVLLDQQRRNASSVGADATIGHFLTDSVYVRATYRYLGSYHLSGSAAFPLDPSIPIPLAFDQDYHLHAHGAYLGIGYQHTVAGPLFVDLSAEAGAAWLTSVSRQGANIGDTLGHPRATRTQCSGGGEIGLGAHLNSRFDLILKTHADWLGTAATGVVAQDTVAPDGIFGINAGEQLKLRKLVNYGVGVALRIKIG